MFSSKNDKVTQVYNTKRHKSTHFDIQTAIFGGNCKYFFAKYFYW